MTSESPATYVAGVGAVTGYGWGFDTLVAGLAQVAVTIPDPPSGLRGPNAGARLVDPAEVAVVKAHGSGTPINDGVELAVAGDLLAPSDGPFGPSVRLCSYKPLVGHCMAAAALVELAALLAGYQIDRLPGPVTGDPADPRLSDGGPPPPGLALCGSVGLGGANSASLFDIPRGEPA